MHAINNFNWPCPSASGGGTRSISTFFIPQIRRTRRRGGITMTRNLSWNHRARSTEINVTEPIGIIKPTGKTSLSLQVIPTSSGKQRAPNVQHLSASSMGTRLFPHRTSCCTSSGRWVPTSKSKGAATRPRKIWPMPREILREGGAQISYWDG